MPVKVKYSDELYHHGILGQKWGIRRFQNPDGTYTPEGLKRYGRDSKSSSKANSRQKKIVSKLIESDPDATNNRIPHQIFSILGANNKVLYNARKTARDYFVERNRIDDEVSKNKTIKAYLNYWETTGDQSRKYYKEFWNGVSKEDRYNLYATSEIADNMRHFNNADPTMSDIGWWIYLGCYEDGQQGRTTAERMHAVRSLPKDTVDKLINLNSVYDGWYQKHKEKVLKEIDRTYGRSEDSEKIADYILRNTLKDVRNDIPDTRKDNTDLLYHVEDNTPSKNPYLKSADDIMKKLEGTHPSSWAKIEDNMLETLGIKDKSISEMTSKDWTNLRTFLNKQQIPEWWNK